MATVEPFQAFRPPQADAQRVASPPYDVINTAEARELAKGNPKSFLHVSRPEIDLPEGIDEHDDAVYAQGTKNLTALVAEGALLQDPEPHLYLYAQRMGDHRQIGVVGCASVAEYDRDVIKKHEKTRADKEDDRTRHIEELRAHDEPVFLTYRADLRIDEIVRDATSAAPIYDFTTSDGIQHTLWVSGRETTAELGDLFRQVPVLYVADGHHRSAAAARVHKKLRGDGGMHHAFLAVIFPHDQMKILPYNRVVRDLQGPQPGGAPFYPAGEDGCRAGGRRRRGGPEGAQAVRDLPRRQVVCRDGEDWHVRRERSGEEPGLLDLPGSDPGADLPGRGPAPRQARGLRGWHSWHPELEKRVDSGQFTMALHLYPTQIEQLFAVSDAGLLMPPKSTWFEPKLRSGLFVHAF